MQLCGFEVGLNRPFILLAGPCVIESERLTLDIAGKMKEITDKLGIPYVFKASYDKANRSSDTSFRGLGMANGLRILEEVRRQIGVPSSPTFIRPMRFRKSPLSLTFFRRRLSFAVRQTSLPLVPRAVSPLISRRASSWLLRI